MNMYISTATLPMFLIHLFYSTQQESIWEQKLINY